MTIIKGKFFGNTGRGAENISINALKFICALFVIGIHIDFIVSNYLFQFYRIAVPIFYLITGYFLVNNDGVLLKKRIKKFIIKILKITIIANVLYFIFKQLTENNIKINFIELIIFGDSLCGALWYLNALIEVLLFIYLLIHFKLTRFIPIICFLGLFFNFILGSYSYIFTDILDNFHIKNLGLHHHRNFFTIAFPCVSLGFYIRLFEKPISPKNLLILTIIFSILLTYEFSMVTHSEGRVKGDIVLMTLPLSIIIFLLTLNFSLNNKLVIFLAKMGKEHSLNLFIFHLMCYLFIGYMLEQNNISFKYPVLWMLPLVIIVTLIFSFIINNLFKIKKNNLFSKNFNFSRNKNFSE